MSGRAGPLRRLYEGWMEVVLRFGEVQTTLVVALVYALVVGPTAAVAGLARRDLLDKRRRPGPGSLWREADSVKAPDLDRARRLF